MLVEKDSENDIYECADEDLQMMIPVMSKGNLLCYLIDTSKFEHLDEMKNILIEFAEKIDIINMNDIPMQHTIELMKIRIRFRRRLLNL